MKSLLSVLIMLIGLNLQSQSTMNETLPYSEIPEAPKDYSAGTVITRMLDGLGFRYYWATEGLTDTELDHAPANEGRTIRQTLEHIHDLTEVVLNSAKKQATDRTVKTQKRTFNELRKLTLENLGIASDLFARTEDLGAHPVVFKRADGESEFPFWNTINGPIEDAIWHAGQVVVLRRAAGNPMNPKVNVFLGKLNE